VAELIEHAPMKNISKLFVKATQRCLKRKQMFSFIVSAIVWLNILTRNVVPFSLPFSRCSLFY
jgi:hypothetical protein